VNDESLIRSAKYAAAALSTEALAKRLREYARDLYAEGRTHAPSCLLEAADRLERLDPNDTEGAR
jgi:hypothetical protein